VSARQPWTDGLIEVTLRSAQVTDRSRVSQFLSKMDREGLYQRHFSHGEASNLALLHRIDILDQVNSVAVLALDQNREVLGHGEFVAENFEAEFALMVLPQFRGLGIGARLLKALLDKGRMTSLRRLHGMIQASNAPALRLVLKQGFRVVPGEDHRVVLVSCDPSKPEFQFVWPPNAANSAPVPLISDDPDRTPIHCCTGPRAPLWPSGGQVQRIAADLVSGGQEA
jgi:GNAT superfamily N-acetyltransferase